MQKNRILDGADIAIGQIAFSVRFDVVSAGLEEKGFVYPLAAGNVIASTAGTLRRQLNGVKLTEDQMAEINPYTDRIRPMLVLEDGTEWPLGVFVFVSAPASVGSMRNVYAVSLVDQDYLLDQESEYTISLPPRGHILRGVEDALHGAGIHERDIEVDASAQVHDPVNFPAGTHWLQITQNLSKQAGWIPPYFNNAGRAVLRYMPELDKVEPDVIYDPLTQRRIAAGSIVENANLLSAPNRWRVSSSGPTEGEISAVVEVDPGLPWSVQSRGFPITKTIRAQGIDGTEAARRMAEQAATLDPEGFTTVSFSGLVDPRHDLYSIVEWRGRNHLETKWDLNLETGVMTHTLVRSGHNEGQV